MDFTEIEPDSEGADTFLPLKPTWCHGDQTKVDAATLIAFARYKQNGRFLEIGTSAGEGSAALLYGARHGSATLKGLDLAGRVYYDKSRCVGDVVAEAVPDLKDRYTPLTGVMSNHVLQLEGPFDLVHIDAAHSHPWAVVDLLFALTRMEPGAVVLFHDANYTAALSQAAYFFSRVFAEHGRFVGNHFAMEYRGPNRALTSAIISSLELSWQTSLPRDILVELHGALYDVFSDTDVMKIISLLLSKNAHHIDNSKIYDEINGGLWKRELERRSLLAEKKK